MKRHTWLKRMVFGLVLSLLTPIGLAPVWAQPPAGEVVYYHTDVVGSVRMVTDESGAAIEQYNYTPFGALLGGQAPGVAQPRGYAGKERDTETGNDYFGARYYASQTGRFTSVDPLLDIQAAVFDPQRWNRYTYGLNNPFVYADPSGAAIELLGSAEDREKELELLKRATGQLGSRLYINQVDDKGKTRYFVGIQGDAGDFARAGGAAQNLANLVAHSSVVEFGLTSDNLERWGGAATFEPGEAGDNRNTRVLVNPGQMGMLNARLSPNTILGASRFEGQAGARVRPFNTEIVTWYEFGHAWGFINGRTMPRTNAEALQWENQMRETIYGQIGPHNARRVRH